MSELFATCGLRVVLAPPCTRPVLSRCSGGVQSTHALWSPGVLGSSLYVTLSTTASRGDVACYVCGHFGRSDGDDNVHDHKEGRGTWPPTIAHALCTRCPGHSTTTRAHFGPSSPCRLAKRSMAVLPRLTCAHRSQEKELAEGDEVLTTPYQRKEVAKAKKSVQKDQQRKVAYDQCAQRITLACLNCLLGAKIPAKVRKLWATAGIGCIGKMSKRQLVSVRPPLL